MANSASNTAYGIIFDAMHDAGLLAEGEEPNSEQLASNLRRLNDIVNLWQTQGLKLFTLKDISITLIASQNKYAMKPSGDVDMTKPLRVLQGYVLDTNNCKRPIIPLSWDDWMRLPQTIGNSGQINSYFIDKQSTEVDVYFWNTPDISEATNTVHLLTQVQATNNSNLETNTAFPQEWRIALRWGLADDIATGQPEAIMNRCTVRARTYREVLESWDVEDVSTTFTPGHRMFVGQGRFL